MKFAKTLQMTANTLPDEYKDKVLNYKKFKKSINKIVSNLESTGVYEIPENEKCKVIYSLSNKDPNGNEGEIKSSLILYIDKDYVAELSQKDALELNSEEITIDPKLKEVIELSDETSVDQEKVTKERIIKSFQLSDNATNEYIFNKKLPLKRLSRRCNSDDEREPKSASEINRRKTVLPPKSTNNGSKLKRSKSDGDKMARIAEERSHIAENDEDSDTEPKEKLDMEKEKSKLDEILKFNEPDDSIDDKAEASTSNSSHDTNTNTNTNNNVKDNIPELEKSNDIASFSISDNNKKSNIHKTTITITTIDNNSNNNSANSSQESLKGKKVETESSKKKEKEKAEDDEEVDGVIDCTGTAQDNDDEIDGVIDCTGTAQGNDDNEVDGEIDCTGTAQANDDEEVDDVIDCTAESKNDLSDEAAAANTMKSLKVLLEADAQFLNELAASLSELSAFQDEYKKVFETKINIMANILSEVSSPNMKDTYRWREILGVYCDSNIWKFRGKDRTPDEVIEQLKLFEGKIDGIRRKFKSKKSQSLLKEFIQLNYDIVSIKRFYELNQTAIYKILKKHDKRTHLLASEGFPQFARDETFFKDNIVRSLVFQISSRLLKVIPNPEEYFCPICREISYKPVRLDCGHLFCLRCLAKAKKSNVRDCPLCRQKDVVYKANSSNVDTQLMRKLKHDFPREVKTKINDNREEKAKEESEALLRMYGYGNPNQCIVM